MRNITLRGATKLSACALLLGSLLIGSGCTTTVITSELPHSRYADVPIADVREEFAKAQALDPDLELGFFTVAFFDDYAAGTGDDGEPVVTEDLAPVEAVRQGVAPLSWGVAGRKVFRQGDWLVVFQTRDVLDRITPWLEKYSLERQLGKGIVQTELTICMTEEEDLRAILGVDEIPERDGIFSVDAAQTEQLLDHEKSHIVSAPRVATLSGQKANITIASERAYVSDYELYLVNGEAVIDPVIEVCRDGISADLRPVLDAESDAVVFEMKLTFSKILDIDSTDVDIEGTTVTVELPKIQTATTEVSFNQKRATTSLITGPTVEGRRMVTLVRTD